MPNHSALHPRDVVSEWLTRVPGRRAVQTEGELGVGSGSSHPLEPAEAPPHLLSDPASGALPALTRSVVDVSCAQASVSPRV